MEDICYAVLIYNDFFIILRDKVKLLMSKKGKITMFNNTNGLLLAPKFIELDSGKKQSFSWDNEDYRQSVVNPDISNAIAKKEDFLAFNFRHISATIVGAWSWKATEFNEKVLKEAKSLLEYKPALVNHNAETGNIIGVNGKVVYENAYKANDGTIIPAGLNAPIWIDGKLHTDICRKLSAFPVPHIQSVSVSLLFEWEPSHTFTDQSGNEDDWMFEMRIGTLVDGTMVRRVVTKIVDFYETSLVFLGADPFAKIVDTEGKLVNVEKSAIVGRQMFSDDKIGSDYYKRSNGHYYLMDDVTFANEKSINLRERINVDFSKNGNSFKNNEMKVLKLSGKKEDYAQEVLTTLEESFKVEFVELKDETETITNLTKEVEEFKSAKTTAEESLAKVQSELTEAKNAFAEYEKIVPVAELSEFAKVIDLAQVKPLAEFGRKVELSKREECIRLYKVSVKDKTNDAVIKTINEASFDALEGLMQQYGGTCMEQFGGKCDECNSTKVSFRSSVNEGEQKEETEKTSFVSMAEQIRN